MSSDTVYENLADAQAGRLSTEELLIVEKAFSRIRSSGGMTFIDGIEQMSAVDTSRMFNKAASMPGIGLIRAQAMCACYNRYSQAANPDHPIRIMVRIEDAPQGTISVESELHMDQPPQAGAMMDAFADAEAPGASAPYETTLTELVKFSREQFAAGQALAQWLTQVITDQMKTTCYQQHVGTVPRGTPVRAWLANVDDEATLLIQGTVKTVRLGDQPYQATFQLNQDPGRYAVVLHVCNGGGFNWRADLHVDFAGRRLVSCEPNGNDNGWLGRERVYFFYYEVA